MMQKSAAGMPWQVWAPPISTHPDSKLYIGCAICLGTLSRPVELGCGHAFCWVCLANSPKTHTCPLCREVHILDPAMLRERRDNFRKGYRAWRQGFAHGARGEVTNIPRPTHTATRNLAPVTSGMRHDLAGIGVGEQSLVTSEPGVAQAPMLVTEDEDKSIAELLSGMAPPVPLANVDPAPAATTTTMAPPAGTAALMPGPSSALMDARVSHETAASALEGREQKSAAVVARAAVPVPAASQARQAASAQGHAKKNAPVHKAATSMSGGGNVRTQAKAPRKHKATAAPEGAQIEAKRRRKVYTSREETKQRATGAMHLIVKSSRMSEISVVPAWRLPELGVNCEDDQKGSDGVLLAFGKNPEGVKTMICSAINALLNAADDGERAALKWDTLQRDIQWKYQRRMKGGSIYLYESFSQVVKTSNVLMAEMAPTTVDQLLGQLIRREQAEWDSVAATADTRTHAGGGEAAAQHLTGVTHGQRPAVASALGNVVSAPPAHDGGQAKQRERNTSAGVTPGGQDGAQSQRKCSWKGCNYSCSTKGHLVRHMRVHTGERPYRCLWPGCNYAATQSGHLTAHQKKHQNDRGAVQLQQHLLRREKQAKGEDGGARDVNSRKNM